MGSYRGTGWLGWAACAGMRLVVSHKIEKLEIQTDSSYVFQCLSREKEVMGETPRALEGNQPPQ